LHLMAQRDSVSIMLCSETLNMRDIVLCNNHVHPLWQLVRISVMAQKSHPIGILVYIKVDDRKCKIYVTVICWQPSWKFVIEFLSNTSTWSTNSCIYVALSLHP
jgi:hypothetical protein